MTLRGTTGEFSLEVVLRLLAETKKTGELSIRGTGGEGALGLAEGRVVTAVFGDLPPIPALGAIFLITAADFEFTPWADAPTANLEGDLQDNLRKVEEYRQWMASVRQVIPNDRVRFRLSERAAEQGAVTFTSERWRVVLAVNGQRDVNDLASHLHLEPDAALTTLAGLVRDGVIETLEPLPEPAAPPFTAAPPTSEPVTAANEGNWAAALLTRAAPPQPPPADVAPPPAEVAPPPAAVAPPPAPAAPPPAPAPEPVARVEPVAPAPWISAAPVEPVAPPEPLTPLPQDWGAPAPAPAPMAQPAPMPEPAPMTEPAQMPEPAPMTQPAPMAPEWGAPPPAPEPAREPASAPQDWSPPPPVEPAGPPPPLDDRLAALFGPTGIAPATPPPAAEPAPEQPAKWTAPAAPDQWTTPAPASDPWGTPTPAPAAADPRLGALTATPPSSATEAPAQPSSEWAPPPDLGAAQPKKKGLFGRFRTEEAAPGSAGQAAEAESTASSRAGMLAAFSNALLSEYNSGQYGKGHVDDRIPSLLMRVDEQADPIDKPLPVVDDRLDVQALERVALPETQAVPYLALLVSTIYGDAEKAFGRDKAKRGYKVAQQRVFAGDTSALGGSDLAGKLPKV